MLKEAIKKKSILKKEPKKKRLKSTCVNLKNP